MNLQSQRKMAADVLDVGEGRVWIDPERTDQVADAITKQDIRNLVESGIIQKKDKNGTSRGRARERDEQRSKGRQGGHGNRKGTQSARKSDKDKWMETIRGIRSELKEMRDSDEITSKQYRELYRKAKGGFFRNTKHMKLYLQKNLQED